MALNEEPNSNCENEFSEDCHGPFRATLLWKKLINNLKNNVAVKRKRISVCQSAESVFSGQNAADVVYTCLVAERSKGSSSLITKHVTRIVANKVCQALLDGNVFLPLSSSKNPTDSPRKHVFIDDDSTFYQFTDGNDFNFPSPAPFRAEHFVTGQQTGVLTTPNSLFNVRKNQSNLESQLPSLVSCRKIHSTNKLEFTDSFDLELAKKEIAFRHLLTLIELPFLENLVPVHEPVQPSDPFDKKLLNEPLPSTPVIWMSIVKELTDSSCLYYDNPVGLSDDQLKRQEYLKLRHHYRDHPLVIVPTTYNEVFLAILGLMEQKDFSKALRAAQLAVLLLPHRRRIMLQILFKFMDLVANDVVQLEEDVENRQLVLDNFTSTIFQIQLLSPTKTIILTHFFLINRVVIFSLPGVIKQEMLECRLQNKVTVPECQYCEQIPESIYKDQMQRESKASLEQLMETIMDSTKISLNEKRKYLKRFKKHHPDIYEKCLK